MQPEYLTAVLTACRANGWHTTVDTCGYAPEKSFIISFPLTDLFLYDLKHLDDTIHRESQAFQMQGSFETLICCWDLSARFRSGFRSYQGLTMHPAICTRLAATCLSEGFVSCTCCLITQSGLTNINDAA
jgi:hypothetical protein